MSDKNKSIEMGCDVHEATHVKVGGQLERIVSKYGVHEDGGLDAPSKGGFGVVIESGREVSMWEAQAYGKEKKTD